MKLCIFNEPEKTEPVVFVKLESYLDDVHLVVCDASGVTVIGSNILRISSNGTLIRFIDIDKELGFQLDEEGRIKLAGE